MRYLGLDGCKAGWALVGLSPDLVASFRLLPSIRELSDYLDEARQVLIDIPIGLRHRESEERLCDKQARRLLGRRASSVFPAPSRCVLSCDDYAQANARNRACTGRGLSRQSWSIMAKIRAVDVYLRAEPHRRLIREMHPEVCFWALNGGRPMAHNKKTRAGYEERIALLARFVPGARQMVEAALAAYPRKQVARDDIVDALVGAATAALPGELHTLPDPPGRDEAGLPMEIVFRLAQDAGGATVA